jgi:nitroreductase
VSTSVAAPVSSQAIVGLLSDGSIEGVDAVVACGDISGGRGEGSGATEQAAISHASPIPMPTMRLFIAPPLCQGIGDLPAKVDVASSMGRSRPARCSIDVVSTTPADRLRQLRRTRQVREFTSEPVDRASLDALADVARWSGSSRNTQPWRFIIVTDEAVLRYLAAVGMPQTRSLQTATAAIAIVLPADEGHEVGYAYDEGRAAERILSAAGMLDLGAGIAWILAGVRAAVGEAFDLPPDRFIRTIVALGHPTDSARRPKSASGSARLPREESIFEERWPKG